MLVDVGVGVGKIVIVVAENVPEVDRERVFVGRIGIVVRLEADVDETPVVPDAVGAGVGPQVDEVGERAVAPGAPPSGARIGARLVA